MVWVCLSPSFGGHCSIHPLTDFEHGYLKKNNQRVVWAKTLNSVNQWNNLEVLIAKKFLKLGKAKKKLDNLPVIFGVFLQTYLRFCWVVFFTFYHQNIEKKDCCVSSKTFLSPAYVVIMQFVFKFATSGGRSVNRFNFQINASFNFSRRLNWPWPLDYGRLLSPKIQSCQNRTDKMQINASFNYNRWIKSWPFDLFWSHGW